MTELKGKTAKAAKVEKEVAENVQAEQKTFAKKERKDIPPVAGNYPEHITNIALIVKNNAEIRRYTSLGILNYLLQKGEIKGKSRYVTFKWNKFAVKCDGIIREYLYSEPFFINCLVASFTSFSASAQNTINTFCKKEIMCPLNKAADQEEIDRIVAENAARENEAVEEENDN